MHKITSAEEMLATVIITGDYYGYPRCCSKEYFFILNGTPHTPAQDDDSVHFGTGFIPCDMHAKMIISGEIGLGDLINDRQCPTIFPYSNYKREEIWVRDKMKDINVDEFSQKILFENSAIR